MSKNEKRFLMKSLKTKIVFLGSGPVAAKSLELLGSSFHIEAVITKPTTRDELASVAGSAPVYLSLIHI